VAEHRELDMEDDSRACLSDSFREMSDQELLERWSGGYLTEIAVEVARKELTRRGIHPPPYVAKVPDNLAVDEAEPSELAEVARSQVNVELEVLGARLSAEGIPSLIVNANSNRMGPQFSNAAGECFRCSATHQKSSFAVRDHLGNSANRKRNHGDAGGECFHQHTSHGLFLRRHNQ